MSNLKLLRVVLGTQLNNCCCCCFVPVIVTVIVIKSDIFLSAQRTKQRQASLMLIWAGGRKIFIVNLPFLDGVPRIQKYESVYYNLCLKGRVK